MEFKIKKLRDNVILPSYQTEHSAGMDLSAAIEKPIELTPMQRHLVPCGFSIELPAGYEAQIRARSGMSLKYGITMANGIGTIDADFRGEIGVILINLSDQVFTIEPGMRIAQMIIAKYEKVQWQETHELDETKRGKGGYGSTGH